MKHKFELKHLVSTDITEWYEIQRMTMFGSGNQIVVYGQRTEDSTFSLSMLQQNESGEAMETPIDYPCEHGNNNSGMFVVVREGKELLLVSCWQCRNIKLLDTETIQVKTETKISKHYDDFCVWPGPDDTVFVISKDGDIWHLDSSFNFKKKFGYQLGSCQSVSSLPDSLAVRHQCQIKVVSIEKRRKLWVKTGKKKLPKDLIFSPQNNILVVSDQKKPEIHVLNPTVGEVYQTIKVPNAKSILAMSFLNDQISMLQRADDRNIVLSHYSLVPKSQDKM